MTTITQENLVDYCYKHLHEAIIRGDFAPGEKLQIAKLKSHLKVGPTPIREALSRLTATGLIQAEANRGFRVKNVSESEVRDIYATFTKIEILALSQALDLGDTSWEAGIIAALHKLSVVEKSTPIDTAKWMQENYAFHYALIAGCQSPCLLKIREELYQLFERYCQLSILQQKSLILNHQDHCEIAKAALARDKKKACNLMVAHIENSYKKIVEILG